jgi:secreted trypsin-like serine protease
VLTAAHCVVTDANVVSAATAIKILAGQNTLLRSANNRAVTISNIYVHPLYVASSDYDDIALIRLSAPLAFVTDRIQKIDLPDWSASPGGPDLITGWGTMHFDVNNYPDVLRKAQVDVFSDDRCYESYGTSFEQNKMLCAGSESLDRDTCQGDSGGPIAYLAEDKWVLEGVTSFGAGCANGFDPGVYTEVYNYKSWINQYLETSPAIKGKLTVKDSATPTNLAKASVFLLQNPSHRH